MRVTALYAALLTVLFLVLSVRVIRARYRHRVALGAPNPQIERAVRAHGNFAEYAPLGIILLGLAESLYLNAAVLHALGIMLLAGRLLHAYGIGREPEVLRYRSIGMALTFTMLSLTALTGFGHALVR